MNSDMSILIRVSSLPNMNSASGLRQLGLTHAGRAEEDEAADGALGILQARARPADRAGDRRNGFVLADDALVEADFHFKQSRRLLLGDSHNRNAGPHRHDLGDILFANLQVLGVLLAVPALLAARRSIAQLPLLVAQLGGPFVLLRLDCLVLVGLDALEVFHGVFQVLRRDRLLHAHARRSLVDQVDGFVGHEAVGDVALGHFSRGLYCRIGDLSGDGAPHSVRAGHGESGWSLRRSTRAR